jgi:hypothetical protein
VAHDHLGVKRHHLVDTGPFKLNWNSISFSTTHHPAFDVLPTERVWGAL